MGIMRGTPIAPSGGRVVTRSGRGEEGPSERHRASELVDRTSGITSNIRGGVSSEEKTALIPSQPIVHTNARTKQGERRKPAKKGFHPPITDIGKEGSLRPGARTVSSSGVMDTTMGVAVRGVYGIPQDRKDRLDQKNKMQSGIGGKEKDLFNKVQPLIPEVAHKILGVLSASERLKTRVHIGSLFSPIIQLGIDDSIDSAVDKTFQYFKSSILMLLKDEGFRLSADSPEGDLPQFATMVLERDTDDGFEISEVPTPGEKGVESFSSQPEITSEIQEFYDRITATHERFSKAMARKGKIDDPRFLPDPNIPKGDRTAHVTSTKTLIVRFPVHFPPRH